MPQSSSSRGRSSGRENRSSNTHGASSSSGKMRDASSASSSRFDSNRSASPATSSRRNHSNPSNHNSSNNNNRSSSSSNRRGHAPSSSSARHDSSSRSQRGEGNERRGAGVESRDSRRRQRGDGRDGENDDRRSRVSRSRPRRGDSRNASSSSPGDRARDRGFSFDPQITEKQREMLRREFDLWDADGSGAIDVHELNSMLHSLNIRLSSRAVGALLYRNDSDQDGTLGFDEFCEMMRPYFCVDPDDDLDAKEIKRLLRLFSEYDRDASGHIDTAELAMALRGGGMHVSDEQAMNVCRVYDTDANGIISFNEFVDIMRCPRNATNRDEDY